MELPIIHNLLFDNLVNIDEWLADLKFSSHQILNFYFLNPGKFHELFWKFFSFSLKLIFGNIGGVAAAISTVLERVILYFTLVYILIKNNSSIIENILNMLPLNNQNRHEIITEINSTIWGITTSFLMAAFTHYFSTLILYSLLDLEFLHTFSVLTAVVGLFPFFGAWFVNLPMIFWLLYQWDIRAVIVFFVEYFVVGYIDGVIYSAQLKAFNSTLIGIVIVLGIYKFGTFGIFYGPLIMSFGYLMFRLGQQLNSN